MKLASPARLFLAFAALGLIRAAGAAPSDPLPDPLDLQGALRYALDHNYSILQARERLKQEEGVVVEATAAQIPTVAATGNYERNSAGISQMFPLETSSWVGELKATQTIYAGGGIRATVRGARLTRDAAGLDLQASVDAALLDVRTQFYNVILAREKLRVQEQNVELFRRQETDSRRRFQAGSVSDFELLRARVALANAQPDLISARNDYRISLQQLRQSLGAADAAPPEVQGSLACVPEPFDLDAALASAHEHRPELLRLARLENAGEQSVGVAKAGYAPNISLFGGYEWFGADLVPAGSINTNGWTVGVQSTWNLFDGRATAGRVRQARALFEQARLSRAAEELSVDVEVRQAVSSLQEAAELVQASAQTVEQAEEALRLANNRLEAGTATQLDVLTSQVALTQARSNQLQANYDYLVAVATLRKAMGVEDVTVGG